MKRNQRKVVDSRWDKKNSQGRVIQDKFFEQREEQVTVNKIKPLNQKQAKYINLLENKTVVIACGLPGSSKSYLSSAIAADKYKLGLINKIIITRPAISSSQSLGFFTGDATAKMAVWLGGVIPVLKERLGPMLQIALERGDIQYVPMEVIKGWSINNAFVLVEEASDLTKEEVIKLVTRVGKDSTLVLSGDIRQSELRGDSGLAWLADFVQRHQMDDMFGLIDFNEPNDIVRSEAVKRFIINVLRDEKFGTQ